MEGLYIEGTNNIKVDSLAKKALKSAHYTGEFIEGTFPNEQIWITIGEKKATRSLRLELEEYWGRLSAKKKITQKK
jgi:hypothetical protein